jgi:hypothetical protein
MANQPVAAKDIYLDEDGKVTSDASKAAQQIAFKGSVVSVHARHKFSLNEDGSDSGAPRPGPKKVLTTGPAPAEKKPAK